MLPLVSVEIHIQKILSIGIFHLYFFLNIYTVSDKVVFIGLLAGAYGFFPVSYRYLDQNDISEISKNVKHFVVGQSRCHVDFVEGHAYY